MPFGDQCQYADFAACIEANADRTDPNAYCATLMRATEAGCRRRALVQKWNKAIQRVTATSVNQVARKLEPKLRRRFLAAVRDMQGHVDLEALAEALRIQIATEAIAAVHPELWPETLIATAALIPQTFQQAGQVAASLLARQINVAMNFDLTNPRAVMWAQIQSSRLITEVTESVKESVREIIGRSFIEGIPPRDAARLIREIVGLRTNQATAVANYYAELVAAGRTPEELARLVDRYARQLLNQRALTIARTETIASSANGQQELWRQAVDRGLLDPEKTQREWIVTPDDRLCETICAPMDGQKVGLEEMFMTGEGEQVMGPPAHVQCRCAYGLFFLD